MTKGKRSFSEIMYSAIVKTMPAIDYLEKGGSFLFKWALPIGVGFNLAANDNPGTIDFGLAGGAVAVPTFYRLAVSASEKKEADTYLWKRGLSRSDNLEKIANTSYYIPKETGIEAGKATLKVGAGVALGILYKYVLR